MKQAKREGLGRPALLRRLARVRGVYVPRGYVGTVTPEGWLVPRARPGYPARVESVWVAALRSESYPAAPLLPVGEITHDRLSVEIMRGCTRGCRFCQAGMINRPVREKPAQQVVEEVLRGLQATGLEEVSLVSLSSTDHTQIVEQVNALADELCPTRVQIALPSTRPDNLPAELARRLAGAEEELDHARARGRQPAHARRDQQEPLRGGAAGLGRHGGARGLQRGEALLHVRAARRDRRGPARDPRSGGQGLAARPGRGRARTSTSP